MAESFETDLENDIIFGIYPPGTRVTEDSVMEHYAAKRHAVRSAFLDLESKGLLLRRPHRGVEVVEFTPDEVDTLYDVRIVLEVAAADRTRLPVDASILKRMRTVAERHADAVARDDVRQVFRLNQEFHELQFSCCDNPRLAALISKHARMAQQIRVVKYDDTAHMANVIAQHFAIIEAMEGTCQESYAKATRDHLPASAEAYRVIYERRYGKRRAAR